jgi:PilZ domain
MSKLDPRNLPAASSTPPPEPPRGDEKRRHPRVALTARAWIVDAEHTVYLRVHDVSAGGLSVRAPVPFQPSRSVDLRIELPGGVEVHARGEIVWVRGEPQNGGPRMGARFLEFLDGEDALYKLLGRA